MSDIKHQRTPGEWTRACDSYGKVQHSRKYDCVYTVTGRNAEGQAERIVTVAARIAHGPDADLIAAAPELLAVAQHVIAMSDDAYLIGHPEWAEIVNESRAAIAKAVQS